MTSNPTPDYVPKRNANMCPHKDLHASVHSSILHDSPQVKTTQCGSLPQGVIRSIGKTSIYKIISNTSGPESEVALRHKKCHPVKATAWEVANLAEEIF